MALRRLTIGEFDLYLKRFYKSKFYVKVHQWVNCTFEGVFYLQIDYDMKYSDIGVYLLVGFPRGSSIVISFDDGTTADDIGFLLDECPADIYVSINEYVMSDMITIPTDNYRNCGWTGIRRLCSNDVNDVVRTKQSMPATST
jgi:hypothetical protein